MPPPNQPEFPHVPAAFINAIAEEGTKAEAIEYLQRYWNEVCYLRGLRVELTPKYVEVGEVGSMPGTSGFTMAVFDADDVAVGTKVFKAVR